LTKEGPARPNRNRSGKDERKGHALCVAIVAATPSLSPKLGIWAMLGAALLSGPLGLGLLALVQWFGTQAAYLLESIVNR
jgi:hypothetical protein